MRKLVVLVEFVNAVLLRGIAGSRPLHAGFVPNADRCPDLSLHQPDRISNRATFLLRRAIALYPPHLPRYFRNVGTGEAVGRFHLAAIGMTDDHLVPLRRIHFQFEEVPIRIGSIIVGASGKRQHWRRSKRSASAFGTSPGADVDVARMSSLGQERPPIRQCDAPLLYCTRSRAVA